MWDDDGVCRTKGANKSQLAGLKTLRDMKWNTSHIAAHFASQPAFSRETAAEMTAAEKPKVEAQVQMTMDAIKRYTNECMAQGPRSRARSLTPRSQRTLPPPWRTSAQHLRRGRWPGRQQWQRRAADANGFEMALTSVEQE
jgi:hypothetical protein